MIISLADGDCNHLSFSIPIPWFDDHTSRAEHHIQKSLRQIAPSTLDGGREILWRCPCCRKPWYQADHSSFFVCLSDEQLTSIGQRLRVDASLLFLLPTSICPICAAIHLGGMPRIEEYRNERGFWFTWKGINSPRLRLYCIIEKNVCSIQHVSNAQDLLVRSFTSPIDMVFLTTSASEEHPSLAYGPGRTRRR